MKYNKDLLIKDLTNLGVEKGDLLNVKCSLKSIGEIEGGANTLIDALLEVVGNEGTIVTDSFVAIKQLSFLGVPAKLEFSDENSPSYAGGLANAMLSRRDVKRSSHPIQKFAAIGKYAETLTKNHTPTVYAYDVLRIMALSGGKNLKIGAPEKVVGVGTTHVAIGLMGFKEKHDVRGLMYKDSHGNIIIFERNWAGLCDKNLIKFYPFYREAGAILHEGMVGKAQAMISDMYKTLCTELEILKKNPSFFLCDRNTCMECRIGWPGLSNQTPGKFIMANLRKRQYKNSVRAIKYMLSKKNIYPQEGIILGNYEGIPIKYSL